MEPPYLIAIPTNNAKKSPTIAVQTIATQVENAIESMLSPLLRDAPATV
jgi:hypothetical protein